MKITKTCFWLLLLLSFANMGVAAPRFWVSAAASNWNNMANWSATSGGAGGVAVPVGADVVTFDGNGLGNCTINANVGITSINISGYTGTISQGANTIAVSTTATFSSGTFTGGSANITITGVFTLSGAAFTSTTATLEFDNNAVFSSGSFLHNNGTVLFNTNIAGETISGTSPAFYVLDFAGNNRSYTISSLPDITVANNLIISGAGFINLVSGNIDVSGDINVTNSAAGCGGTTLITILGAGTQNFNGNTVAGTGALPQLTINKPSGTLNLANFPGVSNNFTYSAGTVSAGTSTFCFTYESAAAYSIAGSLTLNNLTFDGNNAFTATVTTGTILTVTGTLSTIGAFNVIINTTVADATAIQAQGNISIANTSLASGGNGVILINGTGAQLFSSISAASEGEMPYITIQKASGTLTLSGIISEKRSWTYSSGTVDATTNMSTVVFGGNNLTITSAGMSFYNVTFTANTSTLSNSLTVNNNIAINGLSVLAPGANSINIGGNWSEWGAAGFNTATSTVNFDGAALQTITSTAAGGTNFANFMVNNSSTGIQLESSIIIGTALTMTLGNIDLNSNTLTLGTSVANNGTLTYTSGSIIKTGSFTRWLKAAVIASGSVSGLFPVGNINNYQPLFISAPVTAPTTGGTVSLSYTYVSGNTLVSFPDGASTVAVIKNLNWALTTANGLAGGTYSLDGGGTGLGTIGNVADLRLTLVGSAIGLAGVNAGTIADPQVNTTGISLANLTNTFYIGSVNYSNSDLPLTLISFSASLNSGEVQLNWSIQAEINNDYFTVQRSTNDQSWENIQQFGVDSASSTDSSYIAIDPHPYSGTSFYRLMLTNPDGNEIYSPVRSVILGKGSSIITIYPNPASDHIIILFPTTRSYATSLFNNNGQMMIAPVLSSGKSLELNVSNMGPGIYFIHVDQTGQSETKKVVIYK
jgi:hypothetical protein